MGFILNRNAELEGPEGKTLFYAGTAKEVIPDWAQAQLADDIWLDDGGAGHARVVPEELRPINEDES